MLGTIVNAVAIIVGSFFGILIKGGLKEKYKEIITQCLALSVFFVGASGTITGMQDKNAEPILYIISLVIGSVIGTKIDIDLRLSNLGDKLQERFAKGEGSFSEGFVMASLIFCIGTMAILGSLQSGISGNHTTLFIKSVLDGISAIIFASSFGIGVTFSALAVFLYQGAITMLAIFIEPFITSDMIREINIVGGILICALGLNMLFKKLNIKVANILPSVLVPVIYFLPPVQAFISAIKTFFMGFM